MSPVPRALPLAMLAALAASCGVRPVPHRSVAAILDGVPDTVHTSVVAVVLPDGSLCTGIAVADDLVLTARHCVGFDPGAIVCSAYTNIFGVHQDVTPAPRLFDANSLRVIAAATLDAGDATPIGVSEVIVETTAPGTPLCGNDVALLRTRDRAAPPVGDVRLDVAPVEGEPLAYAGYGRTSDDGTGLGVRRTLPDGSTPGLVQLGPFDGQQGMEIVAASEFEAAAGVCPGDSGSPAFDAVGSVVGIVSRGSSCTAPAVYSRVDAHGQWLRDTVRDDDVTRGVPVPAWVDPPANGSAGFGDACRGDAQCAGSLACVVVSGERRCTDPTCTACPSHWHCGASTTARACVPDAPLLDDAGTGGSEGAMPVAKCGCDAAGSARAGLRGAWWLVLAMVLSPRRRVASCSGTRAR